MFPRVSVPLLVLAAALPAAPALAAPNMQGIASGAYCPATREGSVQVRVTASARVTFTLLDGSFATRTVSLPAGGSSVPVLAAFGRAPRFTYLPTGGYAWFVATPSAGGAIGVPTGGAIRRFCEGPILPS